MSLTYSSKGTPIMVFGKFQLTFTNTKSSEGKWQWITVSNGNLKDIVKPTLDSLKVKVMPLKMRNRARKVLSKYVRDDGFIYKEDLENIHKDLQALLGENVLLRIDNLLEMLG